MDETGPRIRNEALRDRELVERMLAGDEHAFAELVAEHHGSLLRLAKAFGQAVPCGEAHAAWRAILDALPAFDATGRLRVFVLSVFAQRLLRGAAASAIRRDRCDDVDAQDFDRDGHWKRPPSTWDDDRIARQDGIETVERALACLPTLERVVITLHDVDRLSVEDVSAVVDMPAPQVQAVLDHGRRGLRRSIDAFLTDRGTPVGVAQARAAARGPSAVST